MTEASESKWNTLNKIQFKFNLLGVNIMGFWSSIGSAISSGFSSFCSAVGGALSSALAIVSPMLALGIEAIKAVATIAHTVLTELGIIQPEEKVDDIGDRVQQASEAGIKPENYEKFDEYVTAIRGFELDPEKSKKTSESEKLLTGLSFASLALEDKFKGSDAGNLSNLWLLVAKNPDFFTGDRISSILSATTDIKSIKDYFDGKLTSSGADIIEQKLFDAEKSLSPEKTDNAIYADIDTAKANYNRME